MQQLILLYKNWKGVPPLKVETLPKAGSNRQYVRMHGQDGTSVIGVIGPDVKENHSFIYLSRHFHGKGLPVPKLLAATDDETRYLQEDLGTVSLYQMLAKGREDNGNYSEAETELIRRTIRLLPHVQVKGAEGLDFSQTLPPVEFDHRTAMFDLHYFKYCFLRTTDLPHDEVRLEDDFCHMGTDLVACAAGHTTFLYRDFQARNVMMKPADNGTDQSRTPCFIDYQGGQRGPIHYDVASFLWQASARYPQKLREEMIEEYIDELSTLITVNRDTFRQQLDLFVLFRILQVLGAYGLRGYFERKKYFIDSIPHAIANLRRMLLEGVCNPYPYMEQVLRQLVDLPQFNTPAPRYGEASTSPYDGQGKLVVRVFSFSYKKGIPTDESGNGGGYVFDCRATHNPGRYEPYKQLTGLDEPVVRFLEDDGEILAFLDSVYKLADAHVERYIKRGFTSLMFCFGCTGGRHRSVYSAQHLAEHLHAKFGIEVRICHREQNITQVMPAVEHDAAGTPT